MSRIPSVLVSSAVLAALSFPWTAASLSGQDAEDTDDTSTPDLEVSGWTLGAGIGAQVPTGQLAEYVNPGVSLQGHLSFPVWRRGLLGIRLQGGWAMMGNRVREDRVVVEQIPVDVRIQTTQEVIHGGVGPQLLFRLGPLGGHAYGTVGAINFSTETEVSLDPDSGDDIRLSTTDQNSAWEWDFSVGAGLRYSLVAIDVAYHFRGDTRYLPVVNIPEDDPAAMIEPIEGQANFFALTLTLWLGDDFEKSVANAQDTP